jgi:thiamine biosynthesis lipoprotein
MERHPGTVRPPAPAPRRRAPLLLLLGALLLLGGCEVLPVTETARMMGTEVRVTVHRAPGLSGEQARDAAIAALREMDRIEQMVWREQMRRLNITAGKDRYPVGRELLALIQRSYDYAERTRGAFRPDLGPLVRLWAIGTDSARLPDPWEVNRALEIVDSTYFVQLDSALARLEPRGAALDLGGVAKGYAVDRAVEVLHELGVTAAMVWAGGDLRVFGEKAEGGPWRIGVRHPRQGGEFLAIIALSEGAVATSGDYERVAELEGGRYHHILDPATGYPSDASISATAVAPTCEAADAWATAFFVLGPVEGSLLAERERIPALIADESAGGRVRAEATPLFERLVVEPSPEDSLTTAK